MRKILLVGLLLSTSIFAMQAHASCNPTGSKYVQCGCTKNPHSVKQTIWTDEKGQQCKVTSEPCSCEPVTSTPNTGTPHTGAPHTVMSGSN